MTTLFYGLQIGINGILAQQKALDVTGHNIANVNTPGFTRQEAIFVSTASESIPGFNRSAGAQIGSGVTIEKVQRVRDEFIDAQIRNESSLGGYWESKRDALGRVEGILGEPSDYGLRATMDKFWQAWQELSKNPESMAVRTVVRSSAQALTDTFHQFDRQISAYLTDLNSSLTVKVNEVNAAVDQIAALNKQIVGAEISGDKANDLRDKRELMQDTLSKLINFSYTEDSLGNVNVQVAGQNVVSGATATHLAVDMTTFALSVGGFAVSPTAGSVKGRIDSIADVTALRDKVDDLASALVGEVNRVHQDGYYLPEPMTTDGNFFDPANITAEKISLLQGIEDGDLNLIAASKYADSTGDGSNALDLYQVNSTKLADLGNVTLGDHYRAIIAKLGVDSRSASDMVESQDILVSSLDTRKQETSGVSLDEEMANLIKFQNAYNAAARLVTTIDEMMEVVVNRMGLVGR